MGSTAHAEEVEQDVKSTFPMVSGCVAPGFGAIQKAVITAEAPKIIISNVVDLTKNSSLTPESDPNGYTVSTPGAKMDAGKAPVLRGMLHYFPRALTHVSMVSQAGHNKGYPWKGWENVPEGIVRYGDAMIRHLLAEDIEGPIDAKDTKMLHAAQVAWNALARLELILREQEKK